MYCQFFQSHTITEINEYHFPTAGWVISARSSSIIEKQSCEMSHYTSTCVKQQTSNNVYTSKLQNWNSTAAYSHATYNVIIIFCGESNKSPLSLFSVPARLRKGQGAKEIGHNLACERPKFGHNLVRKRHKIFYAWTTKKIWSCGRLMKTWAQICKHFTSIFTSAVWKHKNSNYIL